MNASSAACFWIWEYSSCRSPLSNVDWAWCVHSI